MAFRNWLKQHEGWILPCAFLLGVVLAYGAVGGLAKWPSIQDALVGLGGFMAGISVGTWVRALTWREMSFILASASVLWTTNGAIGTVCYPNGPFEASLCGAFDGLHQWAPAFLAFGFTFTGAVISQYWP